MSINIEFKGVNRVRNTLRRLASLMPEIVDPELSDWAKDTAKELKRTPYPPKRPAQKYVRTGRLANSWKVGHPKRGVVSVLNSAKYAGFVVGDKQAWMHEGRWWKASEEVQKYTRALTLKLTKAIENASD